MASRAFLGEFEQMVLLAILRLGSEATGPGVARVLEERAGRDVSRGALYTALGRLEEKGHLEWEIEAPTSRSRGNRRRKFQVTAEGLAELAAARHAFERLWEGMEGAVEGAASRGGTS